MSPVVLTILIAWALLSVMFLTGTLLAARSIDRSVAIIKPNVDEIGTEAGFIAEAKKIEKLSTEIRAAAAPLNDQALGILKIAKEEIDPKLKEILGKVGRINAVANEINGTVLEIGSTVDSIYGSVGSISSSVKSIESDVKEINGSARGILSSGGSILSRANSIDSSVATIVNIATDIDTTARAIKVDFVGIDANVGQQGRGGAFASHINGHANSIDCSLPFDLAGLGGVGDIVNQLLTTLNVIKLPEVGFGGSRCAQ